MDRDALPELVLQSLDEESGAGDLARRTYQSRTQFFRLFQALIAESPGAMRRRFLLERAAWQLGRTRTPVTEVALDAGFGVAGGILESVPQSVRSFAEHLSPLGRVADSPACTQ